jgi:nucleoside-diphosphate-sugar epimerase
VSPPPRKNIRSCPALVFSHVSRNIFISGGTGYIGASLIPRLLEGGHSVRSLCRPGSEHKLTPGAEPVRGNALDPTSFSPSGCDTFVHLVGTPHPAPWKGAEFRAIDLVSFKSSVAAAKLAQVSHFVYVSVAHPAPIMHSYIEVRKECERLLARTRVRASILRPWYVLGPGHRWPFALAPVYWACERLPGMREGARRLGLVTLEEMVETLVWSIENPPYTSRVLSVAQIRAFGHSSAHSLPGLYRARVQT